MSSSSWSAEDIPDLSASRALVTGVTAGLGSSTVVELARHGAEVMMAGRNQAKLDETVAAIRSEIPGARLRPIVLDLADLRSVRRAAEESASYGPIDILVNNAGVMATPKRRTHDGFELQFGTNHLGPFAFTGLVFPQLVASGAARVVTVSSVAHQLVRSVPLGDPRKPRRRYQKWVAYAESKLANLLFAFELDRRVRKRELPVVSVAAHPGYASTDLVTGGRRLGGRRPVGTMIEAATRLVAQSSAQGALPQLMAATEPDLPGGTYLGPDGQGELRGAPIMVGTTGAARDEEMAARLWEVSEQATGVQFP